LFFFALSRLCVVKIMNQQLQNAYREGRRILQDTAADGFKPLEGFNEKAGKIINDLYSHETDDDYFAHVTGETIPRLFAADVSTGYSFFNNREILDKIWSIYNRASRIITSKIKLPQITLGKNPPFRTACVTSIFSDYIGPSKDISDLALYLDRKLFEPVVISTNQFNTIRRLHSSSVPGQSNTNMGIELEKNGIRVISIPEQNNIADLALKLIEICLEEKIDIVISNASLFSFPEACLAVSGAVLSFFDFHRGFPLYSDGIDAILHWLESTRDKQLSLWIEKGGKVIDYNYILKVPSLPRRPEKKDDMVYFITASNYLERRLSPEFCELVSRLMMEFPNTRYQLIGSCDTNTVKLKFNSAVLDRIEFKGSIKDEILMLAYFANADIYLNEFPVGGGRVVLEAMSAYLPVVAMKCGDLHVENIAAEQVGEFAIKEYSPEKYYALVKELVTSSEKREKAALVMRKRIEEVYDFKKNVDFLASKMLEIHMDKLGKL